MSYGICTFLRSAPSRASPALSSASASPVLQLPAAARLNCPSLSSAYSSPASLLLSPSLLLSYTCIRTALQCQCSKVPSSYKTQNREQRTENREQRTENTYSHDISSEYALRGVRQRHRLRESRVRWSELPLPHLSLYDRAPHPARR
jgi:hypothetical protein